MKEIIKNLYKFLTNNSFMGAKEQMAVIQNLKELETKLLEDGKVDIANLLASDMDEYYPIDAVCEILDDKTGVFCNGHTLVKTSKTMRKHYPNEQEFNWYLERINHGEYLYTECTRKPKRFWVSNYEYVFLMPDMDDVKEIARDILFELHNVSENIREKIKTNSFHELWKLLEKMKAEGENFIFTPGIHEEVLESNSVIQHISDMKEIYNMLLIKPENMTMEEIETLEKCMLKKLNQEGYYGIYAN